MARKAYPVRKFKPARGSVKDLKFRRVYWCECGMTYPKKPPQCIAKGCGRIAFLHFDSVAECNRWAVLLILQGRGIITDLRRQVTIPLHAAGVNGKALVGKFIPDFEYIRDEKRVVEDVKGIVLDLASWKLRHFKAEYGFDVLITK